jgi:hypothetical protein
MKKVALIAYLFCTSCVNPQLQAQIQAHQAKINEYSYCDHLPTFLESADCVASAKATDPFVYDGNARALFENYAVLAEKVRAGKMTDAEARLTMTEKINAVNQQKAQDQATAAMIQAAQRPVYIPPPPQQQYLLPTAPPPRAVQTNCYMLGNNLHCDTM